MLMLRGWCRHAPVGYINTDDAGLQQFSVLVGAGCQQPALVVGQTVAHKEDVVLLGGLAERLPELCLLVFHRSQNEWWRVQTQTFRPLHTGGIGDTKTLSVYLKSPQLGCNPFLSLPQVMILPPVANQPVFLVIPQLSQAFVASNLKPIQGVKQSFQLFSIHYMPKRISTLSNLFLCVCFTASQLVWTTRTGSYLRVLQCHVNGKTRAEACQSLEVSGVGQRPTTLGEYGEGQRFEVLAVDVTLAAVHRLQQILTGNNLK